MTDSVQTAVDISTIISGVATGGALIVAAITYRGQVKDKRREQASRILVERAEARMVKVVNRSELPIYNLGVEYNRGSGPEGGERPPGGLEYQQDRLGQNEESEIQLRYASGGGALSKHHVIFRDATGRWWRRSQWGQLSPLPFRKQIARFFHVLRKDFFH